MLGSPLPGEAVREFGAPQATRKAGWVRRVGGLLWGVAVAGPWGLACARTAGPRGARPDVTAGPPHARAPAHRVHFVPVDARGRLAGMKCTYTVQNAPLAPRG